MNCPKCNGLLPDDSVFCSFCGCNIEEVRAANEAKGNRCPRCENPLPDNSVFCPYCGCNIEDVRVSNETKENRCPNCKNVVPEDSDFCPYCGTQIGVTPSNSPVFLKQEGSFPDIPNKQSVKKGKKTKIIIVVALLAVVAIIAGIIASPTLMLRIKYSRANKLLERGEYAAAYAAFEELGSYEDAETMLSETRYLEAIALQKAGDYKSANIILLELKDYKDSEALYHRHVFKTISKTEPTCTEAGAYTNLCDVCKYTYETPLKAKGHSYKVTSRTEASCVEFGEEVSHCEDCNAEKITPLWKTDHKFKVLSKKDATCLAEGKRELSCSVCGEKKTEPLSKTSHSYSNATCTAAKTCKTCGTTSGSALGHTNTAICTRCGVRQFKTQFYHGDGPGSITGITLPNGLYNITFTHTGQHNFIAYLSRGGYGFQSLVANTIGKGTYVHQLRVNDSSPVQNGVLNITYADGLWGVSIEAAGN